MEYKSINQIAEDYSNGRYNNPTPYPDQRKFKVDHVFDEEQSVKWNREEVERQNVEIDTQRNLWNEESNKLSDNLRDDVINNLVYDYDLNQKQAELTYDTAYQNKHSAMTDVFYYAADLAEYFQKMSKLEG